MVAYNFKVNTLTTYGNSMYPGNYVDVYFKGVDGTKIILTETPEITVRGNEFEGIDTFVVKKYRNGALYKTEMVKYRITGKKISGY